jgi:hypothetical protein
MNRTKHLATAIRRPVLRLHSWSRRGYFFRSTFFGFECRIARPRVLDRRFSPYRKRSEGPRGSLGSAHRRLPPGERVTTLELKSQGLAKPAMAGAGPWVASQRKRCEIFSQRMPGETQVRRNFPPLCHPKGRPGSLTYGNQSTHQSWHAACFNYDRQRQKTIPS